MGQQNLVADLMGFPLPLFLGEGCSALPADLVPYTEVDLTLVPSQTALIIKGRVALITHIFRDLLVDLLYVYVEVDLVVCLVGTLVTLEVPHPFMYTLHVLG